MQKIHFALMAIVQLTLFPAIICSATLDLDELRLKVVINGNHVVGDVHIADNDSCQFFLVDKDGKTVTPDEAGLNCRWLLRYYYSNRNIVRENELDGDSAQCRYSLRMKPMIWGMEMFDNNGDSQYTRNAMFTDAIIICSVTRANTTWPVRRYEVPIKLDVLPPTPMVSITNIEYLPLDPDNPYGWPSGDVNIKATDMLYCYFSMWYEPTAYNIFWIIESEDGELIKDLDYTFTQDLYPQSPVMVVSFNLYGASSTGFVMPDFDSALNSVETLQADQLSITCRNGTCHIASTQPIGNVTIVALDGTIHYKASTSQNTIDIALPKGIFIVRQQNGSNRANIRKITIK